MNSFLSIIVVTFNNQNHIKQCLKSIEEKISYEHEVIIVDNSSSDKTINEINKSKVKVKLIKNSENLGFSKANNIGVSNSKGDYLFFLNPDTEIKDIHVGKILEYLNNDAEIGLIAPKLVLKNGKKQESITKLPTITRAVLEYWLGIKDQFKQYSLDIDLPTEVEAAYGAAWIIRKELFLKLGGFDERYFLYFEDLDFCRKLKDNNKKIIYYPDAVVVHTVGESSKTNPKVSKLFEQSAIIYHGKIKFWILHYILRLNQLLSK